MRCLPRTRLRRVTVATLYAQHPPVGHGLSLPPACEYADLTYEMNSDAVWDLASGGPYTNLRHLSLRLYDSAPSCSHAAVLD